jgi:hypothetical protein
MCNRCRVTNGVAHQCVVNSVDLEYRPARVRGALAFTGINDRMPELMGTSTFAAIVGESFDLRANTAAEMAQERRSTQSQHSGESNTPFANPD